MTVKTVAVVYQNRGHEPTLDTRLETARGMSKVHALREPMIWDGMWESYEGLKLKCGDRVPREDMLCGIWGTEDITEVTCKRCQRTK